MPDLEVKINSMYPPGASGGIRAYASATMDGCLGIRGIKVVEGGRDGLFVSMPSRKTENGYKEICFPVTKEFSEQLHKAVMGEYQQAVANEPSPGAGAGKRPGASPCDTADGRYVSKSIHEINYKNLEEKHNEKDDQQAGN